MACRIQSSRGRLEQVVEARIGVLLEPPDRRQIVLEAVVVAIAEQADAELLVLEQEAAEIELEGLDADPDRVEIEPVRDVAQMVVDEEFLDAERMIEAVGAARRLDVEDAALADIDIIDVVGERQPVLDMRRDEGGVALDQGEAGDEGLGEDQGAIVAEDVVAAGLLGGLHAHGNREGARLDHRVRDRADDEEPVVPGQAEPAVDPAAQRIGTFAGMARDADRPVALQRVLVVRIPPALAHQAERLDQPPAVGNGEMLGRKGLGRRRADRAGIHLVHRIGQIALRHARAAAAVDQFLLGGDGDRAGEVFGWVLRGRLLGRWRRGFLQGRQHQ